MTDLLGLTLQWVVLTVAGLIAAACAYHIGRHVGREERQRELMPGYSEFVDAATRPLSDANALDHPAGRFWWN